MKRRLSIPALSGVVGMKQRTAPNGCPEIFPDAHTNAEDRRILGNVWRALRFADSPVNRLCLCVHYFRGMTAVEVYGSVKRVLDAGRVVEGDA